MLEEKHVQKLKEVLDEIRAALNDLRGLIAHQIRLADVISLGSVNVIELYLHRKKVIKPGGRLEHQWFKSKQKTIFDRISAQITTPINDLPSMNELVDIAMQIEKNRNDLVYGSPVKDELLLKQKINQFLELKKKVESEVGGIEDG